jgi:hypothetical protein
MNFELLWKLLSDSKLIDIIENNKIKDFDVFLLRRNELSKEDQERVINDFKENFKIELPWI